MEQSLDFSNKLSEKDFELFNNTILPGAAMLLLYKDLPILWANESLFGLLGYTQAEYRAQYGSLMAPALYPEDWFMLQARASRWFDSDNRFSINLRLLTKNKKALWVNVSAVLTDDYVDDHPVIYSVITDISVLKEYEQRLTRQTNFLQDVFNHSLVGLIQFTYPEQKIMFANQIAYCILGYTKESYHEAFGDHLCTIVHPDDYEQVTQIEQSLTLGGAPMQYEFRVIRADRSVIWLLAKSCRLLLQDDIEVIQTEYLDITDQKHTESELEDRTLELQGLMQTIPGGVFVYSAGDNLRTLYCNDEYLNIIGITREQYFGEPNLGVIGSLSQSEDYKWFYENTKRAIQNQSSVATELRICRPDGRNIWIRIITAPFKYMDGMPLLQAIMTDITDYKNTLHELRVEKSKDREQLELLGNYDTLTGLYNRNTFLMKAADLLLHMDASKTYALVYSDINNFSYVNEHFGFENGNQMLIDFANCIKQTDGTLLACRPFSDYYLSLACADSPQDMFAIVARRSRSFSKKQKENYPASDIRISSGIYYITDPYCDLLHAIDCANLARRSIKDKRDAICAVYEEAMRIRRSREQEIASEIHNAIRHEAIEMFLQPKFDMETRRIIGAEALARWRNPNGSYRLPGEFIEILEDVGYVVELDFYIYEQALKCLRRWAEEGKPLYPISVNMSRKHSRYDNFVEHVSALADAYQVPPSLIELEITESAFARDRDKLFSQLKALREYGFRINIDDFGIGYSSLSILLTAPVDTVKIDKIFVDNLARSERDAFYVNQMCKLIHLSEKDIIFEGVETDAQAKQLMQFGFYKAQGYLFDKPIPIALFEQKYLTATDSQIVASEVAAATDTAGKKRGK